MSVTASAKLLNSKQEAVKWVWWCDDIKDKVVSVNLKVRHRDFYLMHLNIIALFVLLQYWMMKRYSLHDSSGQGDCVNIY